MHSRVVVKDGLIIVDGDVARISLLIIPDGGINNWTLEMSIPSAIGLIKILLSTIRRHGHHV